MIDDQVILMFIRTGVASSAEVWSPDEWNVPVGSRITRVRKWIIEYSNRRLM